jgi:hypothetical protein
MTMKKKGTNPRGGSETQFPGRLYDMLSYAESNGIQCISWIRGGTGFKVHRPEELVQLLPIFFSQTKYRSFARQLNMWHFNKILDGPDKNGWTHPYLLRGNRDLCSKMSRNPDREQLSVHQQHLELQEKLYKAPLSTKRNSLMVWNRHSPKQQATPHQKKPVHVQVTKSMSNSIVAQQNNKVDTFYGHFVDDLEPVDVSTSLTSQDQALHDLSSPSGLVAPTRTNEHHHSSLFEIEPRPIEQMAACRMSLSECRAFLGRQSQTSLSRLQFNWRGDNNKNGEQELQGSASTTTMMLEPRPIDFLEEFFDELSDNSLFSRTTFV